MSDTPEATARRLAERHGEHPADPDPTRSLVNLAEASRADDWSMRSALVRLAQPEPVRAAGVLELARRLDAVLRPLAKAIEQRSVVCDHRLASSSVASGPADPYPDARVADLARLVRERPEDLDALLAGYEEVDELSEPERAALPLLVVALDLDELAVALTDWAAAGPEHPPLADVDEAATRICASLEALGVPRETGPPPGAGRRR